MNKTKRRGNLVDKTAKKNETFKVHTPGNKNNHQNIFINHAHPKKNNTDKKLSG